MTVNLDLGYCFLHDPQAVRVLSLLCKFWGEWPKMGGFRSRVTKKEIQKNLYSELSLTQLFLMRASDQLSCYDMIQCLTLTCKKLLYTLIRICWFDYLDMGIIGHVILQV